jgi:hypothetical protein
MPSIVYGIDHPVMTPFFQRYYGLEFFTLRFFTLQIGAR